MTFGLPYQDSRRRPHNRERARQALYLARRSRAELFTSTVRLVAPRGPRFMSVAAGVGALSGCRTAAPRGRLAHARRHPRVGHFHEGVRTASQGQDERRQAHGFWPLHLQELRPAREDRQRPGRRHPGSAQRDTELFDMAMELERAALEDDYFVERNLYPNVDFYTGLFVQGHGILPRCSPRFSRWGAFRAGSRNTANWCWIRPRSIGRPRQIYGRTGTRLGEDDRSQGRTAPSTRTWITSSRPTSAQVALGATALRVGGASRQSYWRVERRQKT